ncbi:MAG: hypothetical protein ACRD25_13265 [Terracidiphilus sp.]
MHPIRRALASLEVVLIFPAALFMTALFVRNLQPQQYEPAHTAQRIVEWYAARPHVGLWLFLIGLPLAVLAMGSLGLARSWRSDPGLHQALLECTGAIQRHCAVLTIALATAASAAILGIVALHLLAG